MAVLYWIMVLKRPEDGYIGRFVPIILKSNSAWFAFLSFSVTLSRCKTTVKTYGVKKQNSQGLKLRRSWHSPGPGSGGGMVMILVISADTRGPKVFWGCSGTKSKI